VAQRDYRVYETQSFLDRLETAPRRFLELLLQDLYPILGMEPTETTGPFRISSAAPFFSIELSADTGEWGRVYYQVLEEERLVMLFDYEWWDPKTVLG
jgi:hypothetical protein